MFKSTMLAAPILALSALPLAAEALSNKIDDYVAAFDVEELDAEARAKINRIIDHPEASHGQKVIAVHDVLAANDALNHIDLEKSSLENTRVSGFGIFSTKNENRRN